MRSICLVGLLALPLAGCAFQTPSSSYEALNPCYARQMEDLAAATAGRVSAQYPQKLIYVDASHDEGTFGQSLRHELAKNQALAIKPELADVSVRYALEELTPTTGYINLRFSDGQASSQTFHLIPENTYELASQNSQNRGMPTAFYTPMPSDFYDSKVQETALQETPAKAQLDSASQTLNELGMQSLEVVVAQNMPPGWKSQISAQAKLKKVHRPGNIPWKDSISSAAKEAGCRAEFMDESKVVFVAPEKQEAPVPAAVQPVSSSLDSGVVAVKQPEPDSQLQSWELAQGSLRNQLEGWTQRAGYQLIWDTDTDLDMQARASFYGAFPVAVSQLFEGLHAEGFALTATIYQANKVLEVGDK